MLEIWKGIPGYEFYEVSNLGNIRSLDRILPQKQPRYGDMIIYRKFKSKALKLCKLSQKGKYPHWTVTLCNNTLKRKFLVHRLVLLAFTGECPSGMECCHNDGNGLNNRLDNLRWDTPRNNQLDRKKHGTDWAPIYKGSKHPRAILNEETIKDIRASKSNGISATKLSEKFRIAVGTVHNIISRRSWRHV